MPEKPPPSADVGLVTAAVTTYDRAETVKRAIESVLAQTYEPLELVVVEDGSDSGVASWLKEEGIEARYIRHPRNRGLAAARNTAIRESTADFIAFLDDDDEWKPRRVERTVARLRSIPTEKAATFGVVYCGTERRRTGRVLSIGHPENRGKLEESIMEEGASTLPSSCLFSKAALLDVGGYDESLSSSIDHDIWMSLAVDGYDAYTVDEPLVVTYNPFQDSMETDTKQRIAGVRAFIEKWTPTYRDWFGDREGDRYARQYFIRVIARLAAAKLVTGRFGDAATSIGAIRRECDELLFPALVLSKQVAEAIVKRFFPPAIVRRLSEWANRLGW